MLRIRFGFVKLKRGKDFMIYMLFNDERGRIVRVAMPCQNSRCRRLT